MTIADVVDHQDMRAKLNQHFPVPKLEPAGGIQPLERIGYKTVTALGYMIKFYIRHAFPKITTDPWANPGMCCDSANGASDMDVFKYTSLLLANSTNLPFGDWAGYFYSLADSARLVSKSLRRAADVCDDYVRTGIVTDRLVRVAFDLTSIGFATMCRQTYDGYDASTFQIDDLRAIFDVMVESRVLCPKKRVLICPDFGWKPSADGCTNSDIIIDDMLVTIRSTQDIVLRQNAYNKLLSMYAMSMFKFGDITSIGVYFSRLGVLRTIPVPDKSETDDIISWLEEHTCLRRPAMPE